MRKESIKQKPEYVHDEWSSLSDLLATLIEKYAADLDIPNLPEPTVAAESFDDNC